MTGFQLSKVQAFPCAPATSFEVCPRYKRQWLDARPLFDWQTPSSDDTASSSAGALMRRGGRPRLRPWPRLRFGLRPRLLGFAAIYIPPPPTSPFHCG